MYFGFELRRAYVDLLVWWFEDNWLLHLGAIVIQMKFDVIMNLLKRRKLNGFTPDDYICYSENVKHHGFFQNITSEQKVLSSWSKFFYGSSLKNWQRDPNPTIFSFSYFDTVC